MVIISGTYLLSLTKYTKMAIKFLAIINYKTEMLFNCTYIKKITLNGWMMRHIFNPRTWDVEAGGTQ